MNPPRDSLASTMHHWLRPGLMAVGGFAAVVLAVAALKPAIEDLTGVEISGSVVGWGVGALTTAILGFSLGLRRLPGSHTVAIVGFPRTGKTTLITTLFGQMWAGRIPGISATPSGETTIERLNRDLASLSSGQALEPTTDQDKFAYLARVTIPGLLTGKSYKLELGDFPGEDSESFSNEYGMWLHKSPFFRWAVDADAFLFVIDLAQFLLDASSNQQFVAEMSASIRAAWQHIVEHHRLGPSRVRSMRVVLVFTKADLLVMGPKEEDFSKSPESLRILGFGTQTPDVHEIAPGELDNAKDEVVSAFADLIRYLKSECPHFSLVFASCFGTEDRVLLGMRRVLTGILPR